MHPLLAFYLRLAAVCIGGIIVIVGVPLFLFTVLAKGFGEALCGNDVLFSVPSPSTKWKATVFERDCGATTGFSTHVAILPAEGSLTDNNESVFAADTDHGRAPSGLGGGPTVRVTWVTDQQLLIEHHPFARVLKAHGHDNNIQIQYSRSAANG